MRKLVFSLVAMSICMFYACDPEEVSYNCWIDNVRLDIHDCEGFAKDVELDFDYGEDLVGNFVVQVQSGDQAFLADTFAYNSLPVTIENISGFEPKEYQLLLKNIPDDQCNITSMMLDLGVIDCSGSEMSMHNIWSFLLGQHVNEAGLVDYVGMEGDRDQLESYLELLDEMPPQLSWTEEEVMAYWVNAYNAFTVKLILDNYPVASIMDLDNPFTEDFITINGVSYSLNQIEQNILLDVFGEERLHFAINCASMSCPPLRNEAYSGDNLYNQLEDQANIFINNSFYNDLSGDTLQLSAIFDWYNIDFTDGTTLVEYLNQYSDSLLEEGQAINFKEYDWALNEQ